MGTWLATSETLESVLGLVESAGFSSFESKNGRQDSNVSDMASHVPTGFFTMPNPPNASSPLHRLGALYLLIQAAGASLWWLALWFIPKSRAYFRPSDAPDASLLAFFLPDVIFFIGAAIWAAIALWRTPQRAVVPLALHVGAASYAALYCLQQWLMTGEAGIAALAMAPTLIIGGVLLWICSRA